MIPHEVTSLNARDSPRGTVHGAVILEVSASAELESSTHNL